MDRIALDAKSIKEGVTSAVVFDNGLLKFKFRKLARSWDDAPDQVVYHPEETHECEDQKPAWSYRLA